MRPPVVRRVEVQPDCKPADGCCDKTDSPGPNAHAHRSAMNAHGRCSDPDSLLTEVERTIAAHVRRFVPDGATLQTGIGGIPDAVVGVLAQGDGGDYGIHSEMFTTRREALIAIAHPDFRDGLRSR
jgi:acyl-CoA hydrolase